MKIVCGIPCVVVALLLSQIPAFAQPPASPTYIRGSVGVATQSLKDWNDAIEEQEQFLRSVGAPVNSWDKLGAGFPVWIEVGSRISNTVSLGVALSYQRASVNNTLGDGTGSFTSSIDVLMTAWTGILTIWMPGAPGLFLGADVGAGFGKAKSQSHFRNFSDPTQNFDTTGDWDGKGLVAGVFGGYQHVFPAQNGAGPLVFMKLGYQFQNIGDFDGTASSSTGFSRSGPPVNSSGQPMDADFSGLQLTAGFGFAFGGK
jgi:hypothetical protein